MGLVVGMIVHASELVFVEGSSAKMYRTFVLGDVSVFQYGRIGTFGTFTSRTVHGSHELAVAAAGKKAGGKHRKGYEFVKQVELVFDSVPSDGELDAALTAVEASLVRPDGAVERTVAAVVAGDDFVADPTVLAAVVESIGADVSGAATASAVRPMLAQIIDCDDSGVDEGLGEHITDDGWVAQFKYDGDRFVVEVVDGVVAVYGRDGQAKVRDVNPVMLEPFRQLTAGRWVFDGELVDRTLVVFDMPAAADVIGDGSSFAERYRALGIVASILFDGSDDIKIAPVARTADGKRELLAEARSERREGVIFRDWSSTYRAGRASVLRKHKFVSEADCVVVEVGRGGKTNVVVALHDLDGNLVEVGQVTAIGKGQIEVGDVVEVRFLYVTDRDAPKLFQPRIIRTRTDKAASECSIDQLAGSFTNKKV